MNEILLKMLKECEQLPYIRLGQHVYIRKEGECKFQCG